MKTPVALIIFNRPKNTRKVLNAIRDAAPKRLYAIADGPRDGNEEDKIKCQLTRDVIDEVDWDCEVVRNFSDINLGCGKRPSTGISWVFEQEEECIILEDDCLADKSFFTFCDELLTKYKDDKRIMMISGNYHVKEKNNLDTSYFFSRNTQTWGWATWKRAWDYYDYDMLSWPEVKKTNWLERIFRKPNTVKFWEKMFDQCYIEKKKDYWDFQWTYCCLIQNGVNIIPTKNLVSNIGFGEEGGTHFTTSDASFIGLPKFEIKFPLSHPDLIIPNIELDEEIQKDVYGQISFTGRVVRKLRKMVRI